MPKKAQELVKRQGGPWAWRLGFSGLKAAPEVRVSNQHTECRQLRPTRSRALVQSSSSVEPCEPAAYGPQESGVGIS